MHEARLYRQKRWMSETLMLPRRAIQTQGPDKVSERKRRIEVLDLGHTNHPTQILMHEARLYRQSKCMRKTSMLPQRARQTHGVSKISERKRWTEALHRGHTDHSTQTLTHEARRYSQTACTKNHWYWRKKLDKHGDLAMQSRKHVYCDASR